MKRYDSNIKLTVGGYVGYMEENPNGDWIEYEAAQADKLAFARKCIELAIEYEPNHAFPIDEDDIDTIIERAQQS